MTTTPLVDIALITYNQEKFIAQAIESVLMQRTTFEFRILIGDDCSTDGTQEIIRRMASKYPNRITTILDTEHRGVRDRNRVGFKVWEQCTAKYIALLDGDDYWTSPDKLQKQVDFLEDHPECSICFHDALMIFSDGKTEPRNFSSPDRKAILTIEDLLLENFIPTCSVLYRRRPLDEFPEWFFTTHTPDWALHIINASHGRIGYFNEVMGVYRIHREGLWSLAKRTRQIAAAIRLVDTFDRYLEYKYQEAIRRVKGRLYYQLADECYARGHLGYARLFLKRSLSYRHFRQRGLLNLLLRLQAPTLYKLLKRSGNVIRSAISNSTVSKQSEI